MPVGMVGRESLQFTFAAGSGPLFVTVIVYGRFASGATVAGAVLVAATSAGSPAAATAGGGEAVGAFAGGAWGTVGGVAVAESVRLGAGLGDGASTAGGGVGSGAAVVAVGAVVGGSVVAEGPGSARAPALEPTTPSSVAVASIATQMRDRPCPPISPPCPYRPTLRARDEARLDRV